MVPDDQTVLANEQVIDGHCERCGAAGRVARARAVVLQDHRLRRPAAGRLRAARILARERDHDAAQLDRPLGGREVIFRCEELELDFPVFTTRPDTLFGATFFVVAPEHPEVERLAAGAEHEARFAPTSSGRSATRPTSAATRTGRRPASRWARTVTNPVNGEEIPMYVADYVLMEYGTGAMMAVPAHDQRDHDFAQAFGLQIREVIERRRRRAGRAPYIGDGPMVNCGRFDGADNREAYEADRRRGCEREDRGELAVNYRLRDWLVSRQRYWGCPIPIVYCESAAWSRCPTTSCRSSSPRSTTTRPRARARSPPPRTG